MFFVLMPRRLCLMRLVRLILWMLMLDNIGVFLQLILIPKQTYAKFVIQRFIGMMVGKRHHRIRKVLLLIFRESAKIRCS